MDMKGPLPLWPVLDAIVVVVVLEVVAVVVG